jgi:predicted TPR repeat methyltransferase
VQSVESTRVSDLYTQVNTAYASQVAVYKRLVALDPTDASLLVQLGQAQQQTGDSAGAIASYKKFLKLAPDDPSAGAVATQLKSLEPAPAATSKVPATPSK